MRRLILLTSLCALLAATSGLTALVAQDLDTFQVPDLAPPSAPGPDGETLPNPEAGAAVIEEEAIPAPHVEPYYEHASLVNLLPVPYPPPGAHLCGRSM